jgi:TetR/AcrR family transcriptional regulator, transcriptional repressor for nem operon
MRYASDHKEQTRQRILQVAAAAIRTRGIERVSLTDIMTGVNLTNGGFYAHFASKEDLIAETVHYIFEERYARFLAKVDTPNPREALTTFIDFYLSLRHYEAPELGCPLPALAAATPHMSKEARARFATGVSRLIDGLAILLDHAGVSAPRTQASSMLAELAGAINLARSAEQPTEAKKMLAASRRALKERLGLADRSGLGSTFSASPLP